MNDKIQKAKSKLLELGYIDNEWLAKYLNLLEENFNTGKDTLKTQSHHAIPVNSYWLSNEPYNRKVAAELAKQDDVNFEVNLLYKDHLLIHSYLTLCTNLDAVQQHFVEQNIFRKNKKNKDIKESLKLFNMKEQKMPKYLTEETLVTKVNLYTTALKDAADKNDEKAIRHYRVLLSRWSRRYDQYLADPEKYKK